MVNYLGLPRIHTKSRLSTYLLKLKIIIDKREVSLQVNIGMKILQVLQKETFQDPLKYKLYLKTRNLFFRTHIADI